MGSWMRTVRPPASSVVPAVLPWTSCPFTGLPPPLQDCVLQSPGPSPEQGWGLVLPGPTPHTFTRVSSTTH